MISSFLDVFTPALCLQCEEESKKLICNTCLSKIIRAKPTSEQIRHYGLFEDPLKNLIYQFKFENKFGLARPFAQLLTDIAPRQVDVIIPVPLHISRLRERTYNQSALMAKELSSLLGIPTRLTLLRKIRATFSQTDLPKSKRQSNVRGSFEVTDSSRINGKRVLLIDDVYTTGATLQECVKTLLRANAKQVYAITLAKRD